MYQESETIFAENGDHIESYTTVDAEVDLSDIPGRGARANNGVELSRMVAEQTSTRACSARKFSRYALGRSVDSEQDACKLEKLYDTLDNSRSLMDTVRTSALELEVRLKRASN
jgi:hypothetical protein